MNTSPYSAPQTFYSQAPAPKYEGASVTALALALVSLCTLFVPVPAIVALFLASAGKRNVRASNGARRGQGLAVAAQVISAIVLVLAVGVYTIPLAF